MMPIDYSLMPAEDELPSTGLVLKKARAKTSAGGTLSNSVTPPSAGTALPNSIAAMRGRAAELYQQGSEMFNAEPDTTQLQEFARQRGAQGNNAMLNALAAQFAGEQFQPMQEQFLKTAHAAGEPIKVGSGMITAEGQYIKDPFAAQDKKAEFLLQQARMYEQLAQSAQTAQEKQAAEMQIKMIMAQIAQGNLDVRRQVAAQGDMLGGGAAQQIGSGPNNEPIFRQKNGALFTYDQTGNPVAYSGQVLPRATHASPTEDQSKAAAWYFQADNARRNMERVMSKSPAAAYPTITERAAMHIPGVGEDAANFLRNEDRQQFVQAASSMSEALLRAATGAGVNRDEARQKTAELVPQLGDKPAVVKQKLASYDVYMKALQTRAGRALTQPAPAAAGADANDPLGLRSR